MKLRLFQVVSCSEFAGKKFKILIEAIRAMKLQIFHFID